MSSLQKIALSLLISILIFGAICVAAFTGGFSFVEMRYYEPRKVKNITATLDSIGARYDSYIDGLVEKFSAYSLEKSVATYILRDASDEDMQARVDATGALFESVDGLHGIRLVENEGTHIHFSTFDSDVLRKDKDLIAYRDYSQSAEVPYDFVTTADTGEYAGTVEALKARCSVYMDSEREDLIFSLPYFDSYTAYRGTLLFYVYADDFSKVLVSENVLSLNTRACLVSPVGGETNIQSAENCGFVFGVPSVGRRIVASAVQERWAAKHYDVDQLFAQSEVENTFIRVTGSASRYARMGWLCREQEFLFSDLEKILMLSCIFITLFLVIFMLFSLKRDDMVVIRGRIHKFELEFFKEYLERKNSGSWKAMEKEVALRRQDVNAEIVKSLGRTGKKHRKEINAMLDQSWSELMSVMSGGYRTALLRNISEAQVAAVQTGGAGAAGATGAAGVTAAGGLSVAGSAGNDSLGSAGELEPLEEVEELDEAEPVEDVHELSGDDALEEVEELEPLEDAEPAAVPGVPAAVNDAEDVEELEELEEDSPEEIEELEELCDDCQDAEEVEDLESVEELEELSGDEEELEELEELPYEPPVPPQKMPYHPPRRKTPAELEEDCGGYFRKGMLSKVGEFSDMTPSELREESSENKRKNVSEPASESEDSGMDFGTPDFSWLNNLSKVEPVKADNKTTELNN